MATNERLNSPISTAELERRWAAVRAAMAEHKIDALLMQSNNDWIGGYVKYFTDVPATNGYPVTVVFPKEGLMVISRDRWAWCVAPPQGDGVRRGTARFMGMPSYASVRICGLRRRLAGRRSRRSGDRRAPGRAMMSFALRSPVAQAHAREVVDASGHSRSHQAVKSAGEPTASGAPRPTRTRRWRPSPRSNRECANRVAAIAEHAGPVRQRAGPFLAGSGPVGTAAVFASRYQQNRVLREGDQFTLLIEQRPGGFYPSQPHLRIGRASQR
jgi:hypothetical protein